ncbi:MAG: hypothetical protein JKY65_33540 [Planctomycetes bacterium]|nr:hypothetical protein [Planctomycetota bacterium]
MRASEPRRLVARISSALFVLAALLGSGCSSSSAPDLTVELTIEVTSKEETNAGRPFYAVIRAVEEATYITDSYEGIADRIFANPRDPSILRAEVIYPGVPVEWTVHQPEALSVGVYFLFTDPGDGWKIIRSAPLPKAIEVELGVNDVTSVN